MTEHPATGDRLQPAGSDGARDPQHDEIDYDAMARIADEPYANSRADREARLYATPDDEQPDIDYDAMAANP